MLQGRPEPYVFDNSLFELTKKNNDTWYYEQTEQYIRHGIVHILRIPQGKFAKIWFGQEPLILPARTEPYVVMDAQFNLVTDKKDNFLFDISEQYIEHGNKHILRIPQGKYAKIWVGNKPYILMAQEDPIFIDDPLFKLETGSQGEFLFDQTDAVISHGTQHIIRVPQGKYAKVWVGNEPHILMSQDFPFYIDNPVFKLEPNKTGGFLFDQTDPYISHGTHNILRVPDGQIAKVWNGPQALLLEKGEYYFKDPKFRLVPNEYGGSFFDATDKLITHGTQKRVIPQTGEVGISYKNGKLDILRPQDSGKPYLIDSATHKVTGFLTTATETLVYPSEATKAQRKKENKNLTPDEINYEVFTTKDSLKVGVQLLIAFSIVDPEKALTNLIDFEGILKHIENLAVTDMGNTIRNHTSQEFLSFNRSNASNKSKDGENAAVSNKAANYQVEVIESLTKDLLEFGIKLVRLSVETPKILDHDIETQMQQVSISSAQANAKEGTMDQNFRIAQRQSEQEAEQKRIALSQQNEQLISEAQARVKAAELDKQAKIMQAEGDKAAAQLKAEAEAKTIEVKAEAEAKAIGVKAEANRQAMTIQGDAYNHSPALAELEIAKVKAGMLAGAKNVNVTSQEFTNMLGRNPLSMFGTNVGPQVVIDANQNDDVVVKKHSHISNKPQQ